MESVVLNEGLERLGACRSEDDNPHKGVFCYTQIERIALPSTMEVLGDYAFWSCSMLGQIIFKQKTLKEQDGGRQWNTHYGEVVLPDTLE